MSKDLEVTTETVVTVKMSGVYAGKLARSLGRALESFDKLDEERRNHLVNTHTVDNLLALRMALINATE